MYVYPIGTAVAVENAGYAGELFGIGLIGECGDGLAQNRYAGVDNDAAEDERHEAINEYDAGNLNQHEAYDETYRRVGVGLQVFTSCNKCLGEVFTSGSDAPCTSR